MTIFFRPPKVKPIVFAVCVVCFLICRGISAAPLIPSPPQLSASSWLLIDAKTGYVITEHNADERLPPASLTKMLTAYIASEQITAGNVSYDDQVFISEKAWRKGGSKMYVREGTSVALEDLLRGIIIQSGNDASIAMAEFIAGSEDAFADLMNQTAATLGMQNSHFKNSTGWPAEGHYSTARDLAILAKAIIENHPEDYSIYSEKEFTYNDIRQPNRNTLLWQDNKVDGIKTGHTEDAGYCLVASAKQDDMRLISVVMGTASKKERAAESQKLITYGFRFYETIHSYDAGQELIQAEVWKGAQNTIALGSGQDVWLTIPRGSGPDIVADVQVPRLLQAPIQAGDTIGTIQLSLDAEPIASRPLVALNSVEKGGFFKLLWHGLMLMIKGWFN